MADHIPTGGVHHFRLTVSDVDRSSAFYTEVLGFRKLMDLNPGAFLTNGTIGLGLGPSPDAARRGKGDRFDENRVGLDHMSFGVYQAPADLNGLIGGDAPGHTEHNAAPGQHRIP